MPRLHVLLLFAALLGVAPVSDADSQSLGLEFQQVDPLFARPVSIRHAGDGSGRLFVVQAKNALIQWFVDVPNPTVSTFLDLSDRVNSIQGEQGLLGLAFHPDYANNGYLYVNYTADLPNRTVISRFKVKDENPNEADPTSEFVILEIDQPKAIHNGGDLAFGPDGYLYIGMGDGGESSTSQDRTMLLGSMLRIDVDATQSGLNYAIPASNPYVGNALGYREEIWAYGFRNPFRFSITPEGVVWVGDVGEGEREEIDIVESGKNYGWPIMEGSECYNSQPCDQTGLELPIYDYDHSVGNTVTGGYVYRGSSSLLSGRYVFGDFGARKIFVLDQSVNPPVTELVTTDNPQVSGFGEDENGELYITSYFGEVGVLVQPLSINADTPTPVNGSSAAFQVFPAYPNPSNGEFLVPVYAARSASARVEVVDYLGRRVRLFEQPLQVGEQNLAIDLGNAAPGAYFVKVDVPGGAVSTMLSVVK